MYTIYFMLYLIEILHQTTTAIVAALSTFLLYLIEILHQTTTIMSRFSSIRRCILSKFYIKPQPCGRPNLCTPSCILSKFYIKPQLTGRTLNGFDGCILSKFYIKPQLIPITIASSIGCILSKFYIKPQPVGPGKTVKLCCILSKFYIKPQHSYQCPFLFVVVSYRNSTSNHNRARTAETSKRLYLIEILHQTTTFTSAR